MAVDVNAILNQYQIDPKVWTGCHQCGTCQSVVKIKCSRLGGYELQILPNRNLFNVFQNNRIVATGPLAEMKAKLDALV
jgi:ferredoxin